MIHIQLRPEKTNGHGKRYCYRLAQHNVVTDLPFPGLFVFERKCPEIVDQANRSRRERLPVETKLLYQGQGWIGNQWREVTCLFSEAGYKISIAGIGVFQIARDGTKIVCVRGDVKDGIELIIEAACGPALIMALAILETWCLHASAVLIEGQAVAFVGESGKGKSTLARWLDTNVEGSCQRIGDDILPVSLNDDGVDVLPYFPQLKIAADKQPSLGLPERLPLAAVYFLDRPAEGDGVKIRPLGMQEGALALVRHTVASRLFDGDLLAKQLDFCVQAASKVSVRKLIYPLTSNALPVVREALLNDIQLDRVSASESATNIS